MRKLTKYFLIGTGSIIVLLCAVATIIYFFYADQIIQHFMEQLNKKLGVKVNVQRVTLDLIRNFPHGAVELKNTAIYSDSLRKDTIFTSEKLFFQFNWMKVLKKQYIIEGIGISNAKIYLAFDSTGNFQHRILKKTPKNDNEVNVLSVRRIWFKNVYCKVMIGKCTKITTDIKQLRFNGELQSNFQKGKLFISGNQFYIANNQTVKTIEQFYLSAESYNDNYETKIKGKIEINQENFTISFTSDQKAYNFDIKGNNIKGINLKTWIPDSVFKILPDPRFSIYAHIKTLKNSSKKFQLTANLKLINSTIKLSENLTAKISGNISYEGTPSDNVHRTNASEITLNTAHSQAKLSGYLYGIKNRWTLSVSGTSTLEIKELEKYFEPLPVKLYEGISFLKFSAKKQTMSIDSFFTKKEWSYNLEGKAENVGCNYNGTKLDSISSTFTIKPDYIKISSLRGKWNNSQVYFTGNIQTKAIPKIEGEIKFDKTDIDKILSILNQSDSSNSKLILSLQCSADVGNFKNLTFNRLRMKIFNSDSLLKISGLSVSAFNGTIEYLDFSKMNDKYTLESRLKTIEIAQLIQLLENFGFDQLKKENASGKISGLVQVQWSEINDKIDYNNILGKIDVTINQGRLIQYAPLKDIMKYINIREPDDVRLKPLRIQINIHDNGIWLEPVRIQSSAIDFTTWGNHSFDNRYEYHFKFYLNDIIKRQNQQTKANIPVIEIEDSTKMSVVFLMLTGFGKNYKISYDSKATLSNFRLRWQTEQKNLRSILKEELGIKSTEPKQENTQISNKQTAPTVIIEEFDNDKGKKPSKAPQKKRPTVEWKDEDN